MELSSPKLKKKFFSKRRFSDISGGNLESPKLKNFLCFSYIFGNGTY